MSKGFKAFRKPATKLDDEFEKEARDAVGSEYVVYYTGGSYKRRKASGRSKALATIKEVKKPVPVSKLLERAAAIGFDSAFVKGGLGLHQVAKPAIYLLLERDDAGNLRAVKDIPVPDPKVFGTGKSFSEGDIVVPKTKEGGSKAVAKK